MTTTASGIWEIQSRIRAAIAKQIANRKCTQLALADATGISQPHISNIISGVRRTSFRNLDELAAAAGIRITATIETGIADTPRTERERRSPLFAELDRRIAAEDSAAKPGP